MCNMDKKSSHGNKMYSACTVFPAKTPGFFFIVFFFSPHLIIKQKLDNEILHFVDMRRDVQEIFRSTPHEKQVKMFSATLSKDVRPVCKKFMQDVRERRLRAG